VSKAFTSYGKKAIPLIQKRHSIGN